MDGAQTTAAPAVAQKGLPGVKDDRAGMLMYHMAQIRPLQDDHAAKKAVATSAAESVNAALNTAVADLNTFRGTPIDKAWLLERIAKARRKQRDLLEVLELDRWADDVQGFPVQQDAFGGEETPEAVRDARYYNAQGYQDGINGQDCSPPDGMHSMFENDYRTGWANGQGAQMSYIALGKNVRDQFQQPQTQAPANLNPEDEEDDEDKIAEAARKLRADPEFMARGGGDDGEDAGDKPAAEPAKAKAKAGAKSGVH